MHALLLLATLVIESDTKLEPGRRELAEPIRVVADGVTLDLGEAELVGPRSGGDPDSYVGVGILVERRKNVTIKGGRVRGFRCAILVKDCENVVIESVDVSGNFRQRLKSTPAREDATDWLRPHHNDEQQWRKKYGAGICLERCKSCDVRECTGRHQQNGLLLDRAEDCRVLDNDFSFNSGWGIALWRSSRNLVSQNKCDWCVRGYSHGVYARGQDSAGILLFEQCSDNVVFRNSATHSGDGFFLYAGEETLRKTGQGGCNDNLVAYNDFSHAVANAIEATFSRRNRFLGNRCNDSHYGVWAGYSYETLIEGNTIAGNRYAGVAIEHGRDNRIVFNTFHRNRVGIRLWWDEDKELLATKFGERHHGRSESYQIAVNTFDRDGTAIELVDTSRVHIGSNDFDEVGKAVVTRGTCKEVTRGDAHDFHGTKIEREMPQHRDVFLPAGHPRGRKHILVNEWGPLDPAKPHVFPRRVVAWEECLFRAGGGLPRIEVEGDVDVTVDERGFAVRARKDGMQPFRGTVSIGGRTFPFEGVVLRASWTVRHWRWEKDPREAWSVPAGAKEKKAPRIDFPWGSGGPGGFRDRFATHASATMSLPKGRYELRTVSDDGVRVKIDGEVVQEDWTHHAPREMRTVVELGGEHRFEIEHFELDGHAVLRFHLGPVK